LITHMQRRIANISIGPSTLRGMGPKGMVEKARKYLCELNLGDFRVRSNRKFVQVLDHHTSTMKRRLPAGSRRWGIARKCLNVFLRDVIYNRFLCEKYNLYNLERWLELPIDRQVAKSLKLEPEGSELERWKGVIHLRPETNKAYQEVANKIAKRIGTCRVHLDLIYWRGTDTDNKPIGSFRVSPRK